MLVLSLLAFIVYAGVILALFFVPREKYKVIFNMDNISDPEFKRRRLNFIKAFVFAGGLLVEALVLIAK